MNALLFQGWTLQSPHRPFVPRSVGWTEPASRAGDLEADAEEHLASGRMALRADARWERHDICAPASPRY